MKKIMVIALNAFRPENRTLKESIVLKKNGYGIDIYALHEEGFKEYEKIEEINVYRIKLKSGMLPKNNFFRVFKFIEFSIKVISVSKKYKFLHIHSIHVLPLAVLIKKYFNKKIKIVYDCHEYETETHGLNGIKKQFLKYIERTMIDSVSFTITVTRSIMDEYKKLYNLNNIVTIHNVPFYSEKVKSDIFREIFKINSNNKIYLYQGMLSSGRGIEKYIEIFKQLKNYDCCLILMGYGPLENFIKQEADKHENIFFHKAVPMAEIPKYTSSVDFGLNITDRTCLSRYYALPNKLFEYMMSRVPVIVSNDLERGRFVSSNGIGFVVEDTTIESIKSTIIDSLNIEKSYFEDNLDKSAKIYNWDEESMKLIKLYNSIKE